MSILGKIKGRLSDVGAVLLGKPTKAAVIAKETEKFIIAQRKEIVDLRLAVKKLEIEKAELIKPKVKLIPKVKPRLTKKQEVELAKLKKYLSAYKRKAELRRKEHKVRLAKALKKIAYEKKYAWKKKVYKAMQEAEDEGESEEELRVRYERMKRERGW